MRRSSIVIEVALLVAVIVMPILGILPGLQYVLGLFLPTVVLPTWAHLLVAYAIVLGSIITSNQVLHLNTRPEGRVLRFLEAMLFNLRVLLLVGLAIALFGLYESYFPPRHQINAGEVREDGGNRGAAPKVIERGQEEALIPSPALCDGSGIVEGESWRRINMHEAVRCYAQCRSHGNIVQAIANAGSFRSLSAKDLNDLTEAAALNDCFGEMLYWIRQMPSQVDRRAWLFEWHDKVCASGLAAELLNDSSVSLDLRRHGVEAACG